jgi:hypothetical protein
MQKVRFSLRPKSTVGGKLVHQRLLADSMEGRTGSLPIASRTHGSSVATVTVAELQTSISDCSTVATVAVADSAKHFPAISIDGSSHFRVWGSCDFCDSWRVHCICRRQIDPGCRFPVTQQDAPGIYARRGMADADSGSGNSRHLGQIRVGANSAQDHSKLTGRAGVLSRTCSNTANSSSLSLA